MTTRPGVSDFEWDELSNEAQHRFDRYRDGLKMSPDDALAAARAYDRNMAEQRARRVAHDTGCVPWE